MRGTAMGANRAPTYANLFVSMLEEERIYVYHHFRHVLEWWRYIDDIFILWLGTRDELDEFHSFLNNIFPDIQFSLACSHTSLQFLDVNVILLDGKFETELFTKKTDRNKLVR